MVDTVLNSEAENADADEEAAAAAAAAAEGDEADKGGENADADKGEGEGGEKKDGDEKDGKKDGEGAPETYEAFTMPEGVEVDQAALDVFMPLAKDAGLTQAQAQKFVDLYADNLKGAVEGQQKAWAETNDKWVEDAKADKEIGGDKWDESVGVANAALKKFAGEDFAAFSQYTGAGNNPAFIRLMYRVGKAMADDSFENGGASVGELSTAEKMFGATTKKSA
ncbi:MAG: hypothetical protein VW338_09195 [Rhodospirillaceae bacterium]